MIKRISSVLIFSVIIFGCSNEPAETNTAELTSVKSSEPRDVDSIYGRIIPSVELAEGIVLSDSILSEINKISPWTHEFLEGRLKVSAKTKVDDQIFFIRYSIGTGVGLTNYIMTFAGDQYKDHEILEASNDHDLSVPHYDYRELRESKGMQFIVVDFMETVADKSKLNKAGDGFKEGYDYENVEIRTDSVILSLTILNTGMIKRDTLEK